MLEIVVKFKEKISLHIANMVLAILLLPSVCLKACKIMQMITNNKKKDFVLYE